MSAPPVEEAAPAADVSATVSLLDLFRPLLDVQLAAPLHPRVAATAHGGVGYTFGLGTVTAGGQLQVYLLGGFAGGMYVGLDVNWLNVAESPDPAIRWDGPSWTVGPVVGAKHVFESGFTIEGHFGRGALIAERELASGFFLTRVGIGWSFAFQARP